MFIRLFFYIHLIFIKILSNNHSYNYISYGNHLIQKLNDYLATDGYCIIVINDYLKKY